MKAMILFLLLWGSLNSPLFATIDAQIEAIQKAPIEERFKLMNAFKKEIVQMQEQERIKAIMKLKSITTGKHAHRALKELIKPSKEELSKKRTDKREDHLSYIRDTNKIDENMKNKTEEQIENDTEEYKEDTIQKYHEGESHENDDR